MADMDPRKRWEIYLRGIAESDTSLPDPRTREEMYLKAIAEKVPVYSTPEQFGAVGDGVADDTAAFTEAASTGTMIICTRRYLITDKVQLTKGITGNGTVIFSGNGCFTFSEGTLVSDINIETTGKCFDVIDTDMTYAGHENVNARVLVKDINIICESGSSTIISIVAQTYGFFNFVFRNINITKGPCDLCVNLSKSSTPTAWLNQVYFEDVCFGSPKKVATVSGCDNVFFYRCSSQKSSINANNLMYDFDTCRGVSFVNCMDWDFSTTAKIYKFVSCTESTIIGSDRGIGNYDNTYTELHDTFRVFQGRYGYNPYIYNASGMLRNELPIASEALFGERGIATYLVPTHGVAEGEAMSAILVTNPQYGRYGTNSFQLAVNHSGQIKLRVRVVDNDHTDPDGYKLSKWSSWYTFSPD